MEINLRENANFRENADETVDWEDEWLDCYLYYMRYTKSLVFVFLFLCSYCATAAQDAAPVKDSLVVNRDTVYSNKDVDVIAEYPVVMLPG